MMIRKKIFELSTIEAIAFRQKAKRSRGSSIVIMRFDAAQPGLATVESRTGHPNPASNTDLVLFPIEAFVEAMDLTLGLPYSSRGAIKLSRNDLRLEQGDEEDEREDLATVDSSEYAAIVKAYTNKKGELSYDLLNKDFIQFAKSSKTVGEMVASQASVDDIRDHVVKVKLESLTGNRNLSVAQTKRIIEMLDEVSPRHVFRELNDEIRKLLSRP